MVCHGEVIDMARSENNLNAVFTDTANAIRSKTGQSEQISPRDFADQIATIEVTPASEYKQMLIDVLQGTTTSITIPSEVTELHERFWSNVTSLTSIDFNNVTTLPVYLCEGCRNLETIAFSENTESIGSYAFHNCANMSITELPHRVKKIDGHAFENAGISYYNPPYPDLRFSLVTDPDIQMEYIGEYGFNRTPIHIVKVNIRGIGAYAFQSCDALKNVDIKVAPNDVTPELSASIQSYAFSSCRYVENFRIDPDSVISTIGNNAFYSLASLTDPQLRNIAPFDFRKSLFDIIPGGVWGGCLYDGIIYFPLTLANITGNFLSGATGNWNIYFQSIPTVSSASYLRDNTTGFTVNYFFPIELLEEAKNATNWSSHTAQMAAWIDGVPVGEELQPYTKDDGYAITWYSDIAMTQVVTTSAGPSNIYYGQITGQTRAGWYVQKDLMDSAVTISDGTNIYQQFVPVDATITITPNATDPAKNQLYALRVNGVDYTSAGTATIQATQNLSIVAIYWNGVDQPFASTLSDNDWKAIKIASKLNAIPATWNVGDIKTLTYDGVNYTARLVDTTGKFTRTLDNSTAYLSFELTELLPASEKYNSMGNNRPLESPLLRKIHHEDIWLKIDPSLQLELEDVNIQVSQGGTSPATSTLINWESKLFLPREHDLYSTRKNSAQEEWDVITQDQYYQEHDTDADRLKYKQDSSSSSAYWQLSPCGVYQAAGCYVAQTGYSAYTNTSSAFGVALRFAL